MQLQQPTPGAAARRRLRPLLVWSGLTLLAALAIALALTIATLALELGTDQGSPPTVPPSSAPLQLGSPTGHATAE
jgi:hypothetical protein